MWGAMASPVSASWISKYGPLPPLPHVLPPSLPLSPSEPLCWMLFTRPATLPLSSGRNESERLARSGEQPAEHAAVAHVVGGSFQVSLKNISKSVPPCRVHHDALRRLCVWTRGAVTCWGLPCRRPPRVSHSPPF